MPKTKSSFFVIGMFIVMLAASLLTVLVLYLTGSLYTSPVELEFTVKPVAAKEYDGTPLSATGYVWNSGALKKGHKMEIRVVGEQTDCGTSESDLAITICDEKGYDVKNQYAIKVNKGELTVKGRELTILLQAQEIPYSGENVQVTEYMVYKGVGLSGDIGEWEEGELMTGHKLIVTFPGQFVNVGDKMPDPSTWKSENFQIYDAYGNLVTKNYVLSAGLFGGGSIRIVPRRIRVNSLDVEKCYDGASVEGKCELASGSLAAGHFIGRAEYTDETDRPASVINVGETRAMKVSKVVIYEQTGYGVAPLSDEMQENYEVDLQNPVYGTWSVTPRKVNVKLENLPKTYGGDSITDELNGTINDVVKGVEIASAPALSSDQITELKKVVNGTKMYFEIDCDREIRNVGTYSYAVKLTEDGEELFGVGNLVCVCNSATITVAPMPITVNYNYPTVGMSQLNYKYGDEVELDAQRLKVDGKDWLAVYAEFRYDDLNKQPTKTNPLKPGSYVVKPYNVRITRKKLESSSGDPEKDVEMEDLTANFRITLTGINIVVSKAELSVTYVGPKSKVYDGTETKFNELYPAKSAGLANVFIVKDRVTGAINENFVVTGASFSYDGIGDHSYAAEGSHAHTVLVSNVKVALASKPNTELGNSDAEINQNDGNNDKFDYEVKRASLTVQNLGIEVVIDDIMYGPGPIHYAELIKETLVSSISCIGLQGENQLVVSSDAISYEQSGDVYMFKVDWTKVVIKRSATNGTDCKDSYIITNGGATVYTMIYSITA